METELFKIFLISMLYTQYIKNVEFLVKKRPMLVQVHEIPDTVSKNYLMFERLELHSRTSSFCLIIDSFWPHDRYHIGSGVLAALK